MSSRRTKRWVGAAGLLGVMLLLSPRAGRAEEGRFNLHLEIGPTFLVNNAAVSGVQRVGAAAAFKVDYPVHRWVAPQLAYAFHYLPGSSGNESGVHFVLAGLRVRLLNDERGYLANLWPKAARGNAWGNLWVELNLGYARAPTASRGANWGALELGIGYQFSLLGPFQIGALLSYRQLFVKSSFPAFLSLGVIVSFGYPKRMPVRSAARRAPPPRPAIVGRPGDRDGDGIADAFDKCPSTPPGAKVDTGGCELVRGRMRFAGIRFEPGTAEPTPGAIFALRRAAEIIKANPQVAVEIGAFTDEPGSVADNLKLSLQQAKKVRDSLVSLGVPAKRLTVRGYGASQPLGPSGTEALRNANRRIELRFRLLPKPK